MLHLKFLSMYRRLPRTSFNFLSRGTGSCDLSPSTRALQTRHHRALALYPSTELALPPPPPPHPPPAALLPPPPAPPFPICRRTPRSAPPNFRYRHRHRRRRSHTPYTMAPSFAPSTNPCCRYSLRSKRPPSGHKQASPDIPLPANHKVSLLLCCSIHLSCFRVIVYL